LIVRAEDVVVKVGRQVVDVDGLGMRVWNWNVNVGDEGRRRSTQLLGLRLIPVRRMLLMLLLLVMLLLMVMLLVVVVLLMPFH